MSQGQQLAEVVRASAPLLVRFLDGFDDETRVAQAPGLPNHVAWTLGHCALTLHRAAEKLDGLPLPANDFVTADGTERVYDTEAVCYASTPVPDPDRYPRLQRGLAVFEASSTRLARALAATRADVLEGPFSWGPTSLSGAGLVARMVAHNGTHTGQIIDLRRALGMPRVIG